MARGVGRIRRAGGGRLTHGAGAARLAAALAIMIMAAGAASATAHVAPSPETALGEARAALRVADEDTRGPAEVGRWLEPFEGEEAAVPLVLLPSGGVLYWGEHRSRIVEWSHGAPILRTPTPEWPVAEGDALFDSSHAFLPDGRLAIAGGFRVEIPGDIIVGMEDTVIFDPRHDAFTPAARMHHGRLAPTLLNLHDGSVLAVGGTSEFLWVENVRSIERYDPQQDRWTLLPSSAENFLPLWPRVLQVPSGPHAGEIAYIPGGCTLCNPVTLPEWHQVQTLDLQTSEWTSHLESVALARDYSSLVMLMLKPQDEWRAQVLAVGGGITAPVDPSGLVVPVVASNEVDAFDFGTTPPAVSRFAPMTYPRWSSHAILLPTGEILAVGGTVTGHRIDVGIVPALAAEILDPYTNDPTTGLPGVWSTLAEMHVPRGDHSSAILLPDGRVLTGGHVPHVSAALLELDGGTYETRLEVFEPPYLFRGERPRIDAAPEAVAHAEVFSVHSADTGHVTRAVLMGLGTVTHSFDSGQRGIELEEVARHAGSIEFHAPPNAFIAPPGPYMLFLLADHGEGEVPSIAWPVIVQAAPHAVATGGDASAPGAFGSAPSPGALLPLALVALVAVRAASGSRPKTTER